MTVVRAAAGALAGGLLGAALWAGAASLAGQEVGWAAWAVGAIAGAGARLAGSREESHFDRRTRRMVRTRTGASGPLAGGVAVAAAVVSILAGRTLVASLAPPAPAPAAKAEEREIADDETMVIYVADEIAHEYRLEGRDIAWPPEVVPFEAFAPDQFPPGIWSAAESRWNAMSLEEKRAFAEQVGESIGDDIAFVKEGAGASLSGALGPLDLLWLGLAAVTAFAVGAFRRG